MCNRSTSQPYKHHPTTFWYDQTSRIQGGEVTLEEFSLLFNKTRLHYPNQMTVGHIVVDNNIYIDEKKLHCMNGMIIEADLCP
jgi:hypothetical protein